MANNTPILDLQINAIKCYSTKMKRVAEQELLEWHQKKDRMPLILRGARQVGKSTLVRNFCKNKKFDLLEVNLEKVKIKSIYHNELNIEDVTNEIELISRKKITPKTLLFIDEIQEDPKMIQVLRYFYEDRPDLPIIAAGSLLEIALKEGEFSFPVGRVEFCYLGPMSFTEFLYACDEEILARQIESLKFTSSVQSRALSYLKKYLFVGGMPKAVLEYTKQKSFLVVRDIQEQIVQTYAADFPKYNKKVDLNRISRVFHSAAIHVGKKTIYQALDRESKSRDIKRVLELLIDARILIVAYHVEASGTPMDATMDESLFKLYFLDVGLMNCIHRLDYENLEREFDQNFITKGMMAEQFVAQHLAYIRGTSFVPQLRYWLRDKGSQKGEIDFLFEHKSNIYPIEVKATLGGHLKSLFYFSAEKKWANALKLSKNEFSVKKITHKIEDKNVEINCTNVPLYAVESLLKIIDKIKD